MYVDFILKGSCNKDMRRKLCFGLRKVAGVRKMVGMKRKVRKRKESRWIVGMGIEKFRGILRNE